MDPNTGPDGNSEVDNTYQLIEMRAEELGEAGWRCLGEVTSYELVSERENIDTTALNQAYRQQYEAGIIQGSGRISAFWEHEFGLCEPGKTELPCVTPKFLIFLRRSSSGLNKALILALVFI